MSYEQRVSITGSTSTVRMKLFVFVSVCLVGALAGISEENELRELDGYISTLPAEEQASFQSAGVLHIQ